MYISLSKLGYMTMIETKCPETLNRVKNQTPFAFTDSRFLTGCRKMGGRQSRGFSLSHCMQLAPEHVKGPQEQEVNSPLSRRHSPTRLYSFSENRELNIKVVLYMISSCWPQLQMLLNPALTLPGSPGLARRFNSSGSHLASWYTG